MIVLKGTRMKKITAADVLFWAVQNGNISVLKGICESQGVYDIARMRDDCDKTLLMYAAECGHTDILTYLVQDLNSPINAANNLGETALMWGASHTNKAVVRALIDMGADVNQVDKRGVSSLMVAVINGHSEVVKELVDKGADVCITDNEGRSALSYAIFNKNPQMTEYLLSVGANPNETDKYGLAPMMLAIQSHGASFRDVEINLSVEIQNIGQILSVLHKNGAKLEYCGYDGNTALHHAASVNAIFSQILLQLGSENRDRNNAGQLPSDIYNQKCNSVCAWERDVEGAPVYIMSYNSYCNQAIVPCLTR